MRKRRSGNNMKKSTFLRLIENPRWAIMDTRDRGDDSPDLFVNSLYPDKSVLWTYDLDEALVFTDSQKNKHSLEPHQTWIDLSELVSELERSRLAHPTNG